MLKNIRKSLESKNFHVFQLIRSWKPQRLFTNMWHKKGYCKYAVWLTDWLTAWDPLFISLSIHSSQMKVFQSVLSLIQELIREIRSWIELSWTMHHFWKIVIILSIVYILLILNLIKDINFSRYLVPCVTCSAHPELIML